MSDNLFKRLVRFGGRCYSALLSWSVSLTYFYFTKFLLLLVYAVIWYFTQRILWDVTKDTTTITNAAFGIAAAISSLSFSSARSIVSADEAATRERFAFAGERLLHSAVLMMIASLLKYAWLTISPTIPSPRSLVWLLVSSAVTVTIGVLFFYAGIIGHGGLVVLNRLLWSRASRFAEWDAFW